MNSNTLYVAPTMSRETGGPGRGRAGTQTHSLQNGTRVWHCCCWSEVAPCPFDLAEPSVSDEEFAAYHGTWNVGARRAGHGQASATPLLNIFAD